MRISVVIPTYNRGYCIERAINSVLCQTFSAAEIIVVDDGSTDNTSDILSQFKVEIKIIKQENRGVSSARNAGIREAEGEWISLLDSDDEWMPNKLKEDKIFHDQNKLLNIFQCEEIWIRNGIRVNPKKKHQKKGGWIFLDCLPLCIVSPSAVIFKKSLWQEINGFDEQFAVCEDYDMWLRVARSYEIGLNNKPGVIKYGGHADQLSRIYPIMDEYRVRALEKHIKDDSLNPDLKLFVINEALKKVKIILNGAEKRNTNSEIWKLKLKMFEEIKLKLKEI